MATTSPPGLLNMNIIKIKNKDGQSAAYKFMLGAGLVLMIQIIVSGYIISRIGFDEGVSNLFKEVGLVVFVILTVYFLLFANKIDKKRNHPDEWDASEGRRAYFVRGFGLSLANVLPIPFYLFIFTLLKSYDFVEHLEGAVMLASGAFLGTMVIFVLYIKLFEKAEKSLAVVLKNINYVIGSITGILFFITLYQLAFDV